jgi:hypothetical protein
MSDGTSPSSQSTQPTDIPISEDAHRASEGEDDSSTPRAYHYVAIDGEELTMNMNEDYFSPPLLPQPSTTKTPSQLLSLQPSTLPGVSSSTTLGLQSKATIAISLPEGVYAQQQDGVSSGGSGSVTTAPSFSDSTSIKSFAPTLSIGDNDVESMLGEILEENDAAFSSSFVEEIVDDTEDEDAANEDEEGLSEGNHLACPFKI